MRYAYTTGTVGTALQTDTYSYGDSNWRDKLTMYNGSMITYDAIGNPLNDGTWTYEWQHGRQLKRMYKSGVNATFAYNHAGLRVRKTVSGLLTEYTLNGKLITHLKQGSREMHFFYDAQSKPAKFLYNGELYTYVHNLQGDIVGILDSTGAQVVEYKYDAWGKPISTTAADSNDLFMGRINPFRYRGYVYDEETGLYYLRSRYYNPEWSRFVNADRLLNEYGDIFSSNTFAYCKDAPILLSDDGGMHPRGIMGPTRHMMAVSQKEYALKPPAMKSSNRKYVKESLKSMKPSTYVLESLDRTYGMFNSFRETSTTTLTILPASGIAEFILERWMSENYENTVILEEGFGYALDAMLEFTTIPGWIGMWVGAPNSMLNYFEARDDQQLAKSINKALANNTAIVIINESYISSYHTFEKNTYYEVYDYLDALS